MAVRIDMDMPKSCFDCELHNYHFCDLTRNLIEKNLDDNTRADDCPLRSVSEPKQGHWTEYLDEESRYCKWKCSECGKEQPFDTEFCWSCGADMRADIRRKKENILKNWGL